MKTPLRRSPLRILLLASLLALGWSPTAWPHGKEIEAGEGAGGPVVLTKEQQDAIGLKTAKAEPHDIETLLLLNGKVTLDPDLHAHITTRIQGRIAKLYAKVGDKVSKGQKLADVQSLQIGNPPPVVTIESLVSGAINERSVTLGQAVSPDTELFHVVDLSQVIVEAQVYEEDVGKVKLDQEARIRVLGYPSETFPGKVTYLGLQLDPEKRTLPVWITAQNPEWKLRPEMFAKAAVVLAKSEGALAIPKEALLEERGEKFVFVKNGDTFDRTDVRTGAEDDRVVEITDGLVPDDEVVTDGKRLIYTSWLTGGTKKSAPEQERSPKEQKRD